MTVFKTTFIALLLRRGHKIKNFEMCFQFQPTPKYGLKEIVAPTIRGSISEKKSLKRLAK